MTFYQFRLLIPRAQLLHVLTTGIYLAQRRDGESGANLYHCADEGRGFFVEVGYNEAIFETLVLRSFSSSVPLQEYAQQGWLPNV